MRQNKFFGKTIDVDGGNVTWEKLPIRMISTKIRILLPFLFSLMVAVLYSQDKQLFLNNNSCELFGDLVVHSEYNNSSTSKFLCKPHVELICGATSFGNYQYSFAIVDANDNGVFEFDSGDLIFLTTGGYSFYVNGFNSSSTTELTRNIVLAVNDSTLFRIECDLKEKLLLFKEIEFVANEDYVLSLWSNLEKPIAQTPSGKFIEMLNYPKTKWIYVVFYQLHPENSKRTLDLLCDLTKSNTDLSVLFLHTDFFDPYKYNTTKLQKPQHCRITMGSLNKENYFKFHQYYKYPNGVLFSSETNKIVSFNLPPFKLEDYLFGRQ